MSNEELIKENTLLKEENKKIKKLLMKRLKNGYKK